MYGVVHNVSLGLRIKTMKVSEGIKGKKIIILIAWAIRNPNTFSMLGIQIGQTLELDSIFLCKPHAQKYSVCDNNDKTIHQSQFINLEYKSFIRNQYQILQTPNELPRHPTVRLKQITKVHNQ